MMKINLIPSNMLPSKEPTTGSRIETLKSRMEGLKENADGFINNLKMIQAQLTPVKRLLFMLKMAKT